MGVYARATLRVAATMVITAVASFLGFVATGAWYHHYVVPGLLKAYPHDGQIGLASVVVSLKGGFVSAVVALIFCVVWILETSRRDPREQ